MYDILFQFTYLTISAVFIGSVWWGMLRLMDKAAGIEFKEEIQGVQRDELAMSIYFVGRLIALAILFGPLLRIIL